MDTVIKDIQKIFNDNINYKIVNKHNKKQLRNYKNGISIKDLLFYRFMYCKKYTTKQEIVSSLNNKNSTNITRQGYDNKDNHLDVSYYMHLLNEFKNYFYKSQKTKDNLFLAVDGVYNTSLDRKPMLNLGIYDIDNNVPINLSYLGNKNRNKEAKCFTDELKTNPEKFKKYIFVCDRGYFKYDLLKFMVENGIKFIVRVKGSGNNLNRKMKLSKNIRNYDVVKFIRNNTRLVKCKKSFTKIVQISKRKMKIDKAQIKAKNDCVLVTNCSINEFTDKQLLDKYKLRWDIEVFFKHIKNNFKFQNLNEKNKRQQIKNYICELIIMYISKIIEINHGLNKESKKGITKINKSNLISGLFDSYLYDFINGNKINLIPYKITHTNKKNRSFPHISKTPFTKWYIKGYSEMTKYAKIIKAINNDTINNLNKNLKTIAKKIIDICKVI